jgi:hypothetical protein
MHAQCNAVPPSEHVPLPIGSSSIRSPIFLSFFLSSFLFFGISISVGVLALASGGDIDIESGKKVETRQDISMHAQEEEGKLK